MTKEDKNIAQKTIRFGMVHGYIEFSLEHYIFSRESSYKLAENLSKEDIDEIISECEAEGLKFKLEADKDAEKYNDLKGLKLIK